MIKLVAFDWNGTLLDDAAATVRAESKVLQAVGLPKTTVSEFRETFQIPIIKYWKAMGHSVKFYQENHLLIQNLFMANYEPLEKPCNSRKETTELLRWLRANKIIMVIFSNHPEAHIDIQLRRLKIRKYFAKIVGRAVTDNSLMHKKFKEEKLKLYLSKLKISAENIITIGDCDEDTEIGKHLGYRTVGITGGWQSMARLKRANPDYIIRQLPELKKIISRL